MSPGIFSVNAINEIELLFLSSTAVRRVTCQVFFFSFSFINRKYSDWQSHSQISNLFFSFIFYRVWMALSVGFMFASYEPFLSSAVLMTNNKHPVISCYQPWR